MTTREQTGFALCIVAVVGFSIKAILAKFAYQDGTGAIDLIVLRLLVAVPLMALTLLVAEGHRAFIVTAREAVWYLFLGGVGVTGAMSFSFLSIELIDASLATIITFTYPAMTVALLAAVGRQALTVRTAIAVLVTFAGIIMVIAPTMDIGTSVNPAGIGLALASAAMFAGYNVAAEKLMEETSSLRVATLGMIVATTVLVTGNGIPTTATDRSLAIAGILGVFSGYIPFLAFAAAMQRIGATRVVIINGLGPVLTFAWATILLNERLAPIQLAGGTIVVAGVFIARSVKQTVEINVTSPAAAAAK